VPTVSTHMVLRASRVLIPVLLVLIGLLGILNSPRVPHALAQSTEIADSTSDVVLVRLDGAIDGVSA
jgi:hypothetical protein